MDISIFSTKAVIMYRDKMSYYTCDEKLRIEHPARNNLLII